MNDVTESVPSGPGGQRPDRSPRRAGLPLRIVALLLLAVPLVVGALWAVAGPTPGDDPGDQRPGGGPVMSALSDASAQSTFASAGAGGLQEGTGELAEGADELSTGADELAAGMRELQAGIGEAGGGANELANGVGELVDGVRGIAVIQGQVATAIDDAIARLDGDEPEIVTAREQLEGLRDQLSARGLDQGMLGRLDELGGGADELARQLSQPGAELRDGVYSATAGAQELAGGAEELAAGAGEARDGAERVSATVDRVDEALSRATSSAAVEHGEAVEASDEQAAATDYRVSLTLLSVGAAAMLGSLSVCLARRRGAPWAGTVAGLGVLAVAVTAWALAVTPDPGVGTALAAGGVVTLSVAATALLWLALSALLGERIGGVVAVVFALVQTWIVWAVWVSGTLAGGSALASAMPLGQATGALDAVLFGGPASSAVSGSLVLLALGVVGAVALRVGSVGAGVGQERDVEGDLRNA